MSKARRKSPRSHQRRNIPSFEKRATALYALPQGSSVANKDPRSIRGRARAVVQKQLRDKESVGFDDFAAQLRRMRGAAP